MSLAPEVGWRMARGLCASSMLALAACASLTPKPAGLSAMPPPMTGRLLVKVDASAQGPAQSTSASFELSGDEYIGQLVLLSPLGTRVVDARWSHDGVSLGTSDGLRQYPDLQAMARDTLGEDVPIAALTHWLAARPWPGAPAVTTVHGFEQLGWAIDLSLWATQAQVEARRAEPPAVLVRARIDR